MENLVDKLARSLQAIRAEKPLVLNLTNFVAMDITANALLAVGASPIMAHAEEELEDMVKLSSSVVINIGTLDMDWAKRMAKALEYAERFQKPVVLDPVGCGASQFRTEYAKRFAASPSVSVIRGNASEILSLFGTFQGTKGVDSVSSGEAAAEHALSATSGGQLVIAISGATDYILSQEKTAKVENGDERMTQVTAMGCTATALIGAFLAAEKSAFLASVFAMSVMGLAGERAGKRSAGPGSFRSEFIDELNQVRGGSLQGLRVRFELRGNDETF